jgi:hypothetical protein
MNRHVNTWNRHPRTINHELQLSLFRAGDGGRDKTERVVSFGAFDEAES